MLDLVARVAPPLLCFVYFYFRANQNERRAAAEQVEEEPEPEPVDHQCEACYDQDRDIALIIRQCNVCYDDERPICPIPLSRNCDHEMNTCVSCVRRFVDGQIRHGGILRCVDSTCTATLPHETVKRMATDAVFEIYDLRLAQSAMEKDDEFVWCSRPECNNGQFHQDGEAAPIVTCTRCSMKTCYIHRTEWDECDECVGVQRERIERLNSESRRHRTRKPRRATRRGDAAIEQRRLREIRATERELRRNKSIKKCPGCRNGVEKFDGCDHITCRCGYEFCWVCLAPYQGANGILTIGNKAHLRRCPFYA